MAPHSVALGVLGSPVPAITPEVLEVAAQLGGSRSGATLWLRLAGDAPWREAVVEWEAFAQALQVRCCCKRHCTATVAAAFADNAAHLLA